MKVILLISFLFLSLIGCDKHERMEKPVETMTHTNGLVVKIQDTYKKVVETKSGYKFYFNDESSRNINELEISKQSVAPEELTTFEKKEINNNIYYYKLSVENIGSGGKEYTYVIWKPRKEGGVLLVAYIQQEILPEFNIAWDIIKNIE